MTYNGKRRTNWRNIRSNQEGLLRDTTRAGRLEHFGFLAGMPLKKDGYTDEGDDE